jgi:hypothetical protein
MFKKYIVLSGILIAIALLYIATIYYPGGSQFNKNSIGYNWKDNYISNLFSPQAINGASNSSRLWAIFGMFFLSLSFAIFFYQFSKKIPSKGASGVIKYFGVVAMIAAFLAVTPLHDMVITIASTTALVSMFYITVFLLKSKLFFLKILSIICLLICYCCIYIYYTGTYLEFLPIMQKVDLLTVIIWILCLEHFTTPVDFQLTKNIPSSGKGSSSGND